MHPRDICCPFPPANPDIPGNRIQTCRNKLEGFTRDRHRNHSCWPGTRRKHQSPLCDGFGPRPRARTASVISHNRDTAADHPPGKHTRNQNRVGLENATQSRVLGPAVSTHRKRVGVRGVPGRRSAAAVPSPAFGTVPFHQSAPTCSLGSDFTPGFSNRSFYLLP